MTSQPLSGLSHPLYRQHHTQSFYDISLAICVASCALYKISHPHILTSNHHLVDITPAVLDIVCIVSVSSQLYRWYHSHYMYDIAYSIGVTFCPLYLWHRINYVWHHNPVCWLYHTRPMYDIICATEEVRSTLSNQATIFMTSHPLQAWHHTPCIRHRTNCIFVITTSPHKCHHTHFCMTSHPLYVWHHRHYI